MGTTRTSFTGDDGVELAFVLLIEGHDTLITNYGDTAAVVTAYGATEWATAISGLEVPEGTPKRFELWTGKLDAPSMRFVVLPDEADTFGIVTHQTQRSSLEGFLDLAGGIDSNDGAIPIDDSTEWPGGGGTAYIGTECIPFSSTTTGSPDFLIGGTRGKYAPYKADTEAEQRFGRPHGLPSVLGVPVKPVINDFPRVWVGKVVRLLVHAVNGGVLDVFAQAETVWAGTIDGIGDSGRGTVLECSHINKYIATTAIHRDQYKARLIEGIYLRAGKLFSYRETVFDSGIPGIAFFTANDLDVVGSGATSPNEVNAGYYKATEIANMITIWLAAEKMATRIDGDVAMTLIPTDDGTRAQLYAKNFTVGTDGVILVLDGVWFNGALEFLGFETGLERSIEKNDEPPLTIRGDMAPFRLQVSPFLDDRIQVDFLEGTWADVPDAFNPIDVPDGDWGIIKIGDVFVVVRHSTDTLFDAIDYVGSQRFTNTWGPPGALAVGLGFSSWTRTVDELGDIEVTQIVVISGTFTGVMLRLFASTGTAGYNHAAYDAFDGPLALGLPWEILGDTFEDSLIALSAAFFARIELLLDKPIKFESILRPELLLRNATLQLDDGKIRWLAPQITGVTTHALDTTNKATAADTTNPDRSKSRVTTELLRNKLSVSFNRIPGSETYHDERTVTNQASIEDHGGLTKSLTIKLRNSYYQPSTRIEEAVEMLAPYVVGVFAKEAVIVTRTISRKLFHMLPGEAVLLDDDSVRDQTTGIRSLSSVAGWLTSVRPNWKMAEGECDIVLTGSRYAPYSPAGDVVSYGTATKIVTLATNTYSLSGDDADASHFPAGHKVRMIEVSPAVVGSPDTWVDTVASQTGDTVTLTTGDGGQYSPTKTWRLVSDDFVTAIEAQQTDAYQADDADNQILDAKVGNLWSMYVPDPATLPAIDLTARHRYPPTVSFAEGEPVSTAMHDDLIKALNNLISYKTAPQCPVLAGQETNGQWNDDYASSDDSLWRLIKVIPWYYGPLITDAGDDWAFKLKVAAYFYRSAGAGQVKVRVTTASAPPSGTSLDNVSLGTNVESITFATSATSPTFGTVTDVTPKPHQPSRRGYLIVEAQGDSGATVSIVGLGELWRGPFQ